MSSYDTFYESIKTFLKLDLILWSSIQRIGKLVRLPWLTVDAKGLGTPLDKVSQIILWKVIIDKAAKTHRTELYCTSTAQQNPGSQDLW